MVLSWPGCLPAHWAASICPAADMLMRVNEIRQSQRELLIGIGRGECAAAKRSMPRRGRSGGPSVKHSIWQTTRTYQHNTHNMCMSVSRDMRGIAHSVLDFPLSSVHTHTHVWLLPLCVDKLLTASATASASASTIILGIFCRILICFYIFIYHRRHC